MNCGSKNKLIYIYICIYARGFGLGLIAFASWVLISALGRQDLDCQSGIPGIRFSSVDSLGCRFLGWDF